MAMQRDIPKVGTVIHSPVFGGGATITVVGIVPKRVPILPTACGHDVLVSVHIRCDDARKINKPRRAWSFGTWSNELARSTIVTSGANSRARRADAKRRARADVYDSRGGAMQENPFDDVRQARIYAHEYTHWRARYWEMERMRKELEAVYGPPTCWR